MPIDLQKAEAALQLGYRAEANHYRQDDEIEVMSDHHRRLATVLSGISASFGRPIAALDAGCGTGRFFYCLRNVDRLVGLDITAEMLRAAENPVKSDEVTVRRIELIRSNVFFTSFPPASFDLIYSFGMFGHGC